MRFVFNNIQNSCSTHFFSIFFPLPFYRSFNLMRMIFLSIRRNFKKKLVQVKTNPYCAVGKNKFIENIKGCIYPLFLYLAQSLLFNLFSFLNNFLHFFQCHKSSIMHTNFDMPVGPDVCYTIQWVLWTKFFNFASILPTLSSVVFNYYGSLTGIRVYLNYFSRLIISRFFRS